MACKKSFFLLTFVSSSSEEEGGGGGRVAKTAKNKSSSFLYRRVPLGEKPRLRFHSLFSCLLSLPLFPRRSSARRLTASAQATLTHTHTHTTRRAPHPENQKTRKKRKMPLLRRAALAAARTLRSRGGGHDASKPSFWSAGVRDSEGRLFNESPPAPGTKRKWESWEAPW